MSKLIFKGYKDAGNPVLSEVDGIMSIAYRPGERARWISQNMPDSPGAEHVVRGSYRVSSGAAALPVIVFWRPDGKTYLSSIKGEELTTPSAEFMPFEIAFEVPANAGSWRVDLRAWTGSGVTEFRNVTLDEQPLPDPPEPEPDLPQREWTGFIRGRMLTLQQVTTAEAEAVDWPCLPVIAVEWGDNLYLTIVQPEPEPEPDQHD
jgi:hypothetical protein